MSRAQLIWSVSTVTGAAGAVALLSFLPFSFWVNGAIAFFAFFVVTGLGHSYFLKHATAEEIRRDLEDRKNAPG